MWVKLRELKSLGFHFRRQSPIGPYIVDFVSLAARAVIEIDGGQHAISKTARSDEQRDKFLQSRGFQVLRYWNSDVDRNLEGVMEDIVRRLNTPPRPADAGRPSPQGGGIGTVHAASVYPFPTQRATIILR
jgi:very-short-patch-repair endonuclease